jgi:hypothetical protein
MIDFVTLFMKLFYWDVICSSFNPDDFSKFRDKRRAAGSIFSLTPCFEMRTFVRRDAGGAAPTGMAGCLCAIQLRTRAKATSCAGFSLFAHAYRQLRSSED